MFYSPRLCVAVPACALVALVATAGICEARSRHNNYSRAHHRPITHIYHTKVKVKVVRVPSRKDTTTRKELKVLRHELSDLQRELKDIRNKLSTNAPPVVVSAFPVTTTVIPSQMNPAEIEIPKARVASLGPIAPSSQPETIPSNLFRDYETQSLLKPIGNCRDYESVDPRVKQVVADAAQHFNGVALLSSCYRSPKHNRRVHGARHSRHMRHEALDFVIKDENGRLIDKRRLAKWVRKHPIMAKIGGVGVYCSMHAIHADVGPKRNWSWSCNKHRRHHYARHHRRYAGR